MSGLLCPHFLMCSSAAQVKWNHICLSTKHPEGRIFGFVQTFISFPPKNVFTWKKQEDKRKSQQLRIWQQSNLNLQCTLCTSSMPSAVLNQAMFLGLATSDKHHRQKEGKRKREAQSAVSDHWNYSNQLEKWYKITFLEKANAHIVQEPGHNSKKEKTCIMHKAFSFFRKLMAAPLI